MVVVVEVVIGVVVEVGILVVVVVVVVGFGGQSIGVSESGKGRQTGSGWRLTDLDVGVVAVVLQQQVLGLIFGGDVCVGFCLFVCCHSYI